MKVKELLKTVNVAWSPPSQYPILLAAGTAAQQLDASFNTSASLDLYSLNLQQPGYDMELKASVISDRRFYKIIWGAHRTDAGGIIVGGCDYGTIQLYSAAKLLANDPKCLISSLDRHTGPVRAMDFNPFQTNLLATGATESEFYIWDITNNSPMTPGSKSQPLEDIQHIAWNKQVQHILASTFSQRCVIWDLRKNEPIIKLNDTNSQVRWKVVQWHPDVATQLCLASENDRAPVIELWDLRFATSPLKTFQDHQKGVLSIAWNPHDSDLLLSCGKDNRILCWNPSSDAPNGEVICELAQTNEWNFDVSWCPRHPGLVVGTSFDGHAVVYSLLGGQAQAANETSDKIVDSFPGMDPFTQSPPTFHSEPTSVLSKAPKWLKKPSGATFGFGGKLLTFQKDNLDPNLPISRKVIISQLITQTELVKRSNELEDVLKNEQYQHYCQEKIMKSIDDHNQEVWRCVEAYFNNNFSKRIMEILGFDSDEMNNKLNQLVPQQDINNMTDKMDNLLNGNLDGSATFDAIAQEQSNSRKEYKINTSDDEDGLITQSILLGNIEAAVSLCFANKRYAEAIILSMAGGPDLLAKAQYKYFSEHTGALNTLINCLVSENWLDVVKNSDINCWKEILVGIFTHSSPQERSNLCDILGDRLASSNNPHLTKKSQICYITSGNLNKMIQVTDNEIQEMVELITLIQKGLQLQGNNDIAVEGHIARVLSQYAEMLASEGEFETALNYLENSRDENVIMLKNRLSRALGYIEDVKPQYDHRKSTYSNQIQNPQHNWNTMPVKMPPIIPQPQPSTLFESPQYPTEKYQPQVPPPPSVVGGSSRPPSVGPQIKSKYVIDPSLKPAVPSSNYGRVFQQNQMYPSNPVSLDYPSQNQYQNEPYAPHHHLQQQPPIYLEQEQEQTRSHQTMMSKIVPSKPDNMYEPIMSPPNYANEIHPYQHVPQQSGWNDPPDYKSNRIQSVQALCNKNEMSAEHAGTRKWKEMHLKRRVDYKAKAAEQLMHPSAPILHPLDGMLPHAGNNMMLQDNSYPTHNPQQSYGQPFQQNIPNMQNVQNIPNMQNIPNIQNMQNIPNPAPLQYSQPITSVPDTLTPKIPEPEKPNVPIPEQHLHLKTVLDELKCKCFENAKNPHMKKKIEEVSKKLEILYNHLREDKLSQNTLHGLHEISQSIQNGNYKEGLNFHMKLASGSDFSTIACFMPGIKVLLQCALQLGVYIR